MPVHRIVVAFNGSFAQGGRTLPIVTDTSANSTPYRIRQLALYQRVYRYCIQLFYGVVNHTRVATLSEVNLKVAKHF